MQSVIAVPVYSPKDNSTLVGIWGGGIDFNVLNKEPQSFNITFSSPEASEDSKRVMQDTMDKKQQTLI